MAEINSQTEQPERGNLAIRARHRAKDSVFHDLFSRPHYLFQMYQSLHPEDKKTREPDLKLVTLQSILVNREYNDLGFMVKDKLIILVEAQSSWSVNIVIRSLIYLMSTYQYYFKSNKISLYSSTKVKMPKPELYVIYTQNKNKRPDTISLKDEYFPNEDCCIDAKVKVIYEDESDKISSQYIYFCKELDKSIEIHGKTSYAVENAIDKCISENILKEYLIERKTEVKGMLLALFDQQQETEYYILEKQEESRAEGLKEGMKEGMEKGKICALYSLVQDGTLSIDKAADMAKMTASEFKQQAEALAGAGSI